MSEENEVEAVEVPEVDPNEVQAREKGWKSLEEWVADGNNAGDHVGYNKFIERGEMFGDIRRLKSQVTELKESNKKSLESNNELWKAKLESEKQSLMQARDDAIGLADKEAVNQIDKKIGDIDKQSAQLEQVVQFTAPSEEDDRIEKEYDSSLPRGQQAFARQVAASLLAATPSLAGQDLVDAVKQEVDREFPATNERRKETTVTDTKKTTSSGKKESLSMDDLSAMDRQFLNDLKSNPHFAKMSDSELLKTLQESKL